MSLTVLDWLYETLAVDGSPEAGARRWIGPMLRVAPVALLVVVLVAAKFSESIRLISHRATVELMFASLGLMLVCTLAVELLERRGVIDKQKPARPPIEVAAIPPPPVPPPLADEAPRSPAGAVVLDAQSGGALPPRLGGAAWGFERGYVWKPEGREDG